MPGFPFKPALIIFSNQVSLTQKQVGKTAESLPCEVANIAAKVTANS